MIRRFASGSLFLLGLGLLFIPLVYWSCHVQETQIQVFFRFWWVSLIAFVLVGLGFYVGEPK